MLPTLISFEFPGFLGRPGWIEIALTVIAVGLSLFWLIKAGKFKPASFGLGLLVYGILRGLVWYAGPGYHFRLPTYGMLIAVGFVVGITLAVRQAKREFIDPNVILDLAFWILISSMVGSRVLFIIVNIEDYIAAPINLVKVWQGGLVFYGGFIGAVAASLYYCHTRGISFLRISDLTIPSVAIGHFFGRLGCYSAGCCHGVPTGTESFGAVFESAGSVIARSGYLGMHVHPTQLYEAFGELMAFGLLILLRPRKRFNGQLLAIWLMVYPVWRFMTELFRGDRARGLAIEWDLFGDARPEMLSTSQIVSVGLFALGIGLYVILRKRFLSAQGAPSA
jgi:phosphatidylglycerol:prolipoprotein diacylglycerol transferase